MEEKKESWIEKLIELLNEYGKEKWSPFDEWWFDSKNELFCKWLSSRYSAVMIISKKFWFIEWLVQNDKIDFTREWKLSSDLVALFERKEDNAEWLIALLAVSDEPISDLISYLK